MCMLVCVCMCLCLCVCVCVHVRVCASMIAFGRHACWSDKMSSSQRFYCYCASIYSNYKNIFIVLMYTMVLDSLYKIILDPIHY